VKKDKEYNNGERILKENIKVNKLEKNKKKR
jgi:hypothetical protein